MAADYDINSELEAVQAIFPEIIESSSNSERIVLLCNNGRLRVILTNLYAFECDPHFEISAPDFSSEIKQKLLNKLKTSCNEHAEEPLLYYIAEEVVLFSNSELSKIDTNSDDLNKSFSSLDMMHTSSSFYNLDFNKKKINHEIFVNKTPPIYNGKVFEDRKSVFQAHFAVISSKEEADLVLSRLKENSKIARATHNMYAYRVLKTLSKDRVIEQKDCECDGETGAGPKLLRWYGGIHLGPDRFRHITNLAREVILDGQQALANKLQ